MILTIDTEQKTISVSGTVNADDLFKQLKQFLPENKWREYSLCFNNPITYYPIIPSTPWYSVTCEGIGATIDIANWGQPTMQTN